MSELAATVLEKVGSDVFETVARGVLDDPSAQVVSESSFEELAGSHNDQRTIGIVKVSGEAACASGNRAWSAVAKIIDPKFTDPNRVRNNTDDRVLENEQKVYELGLFADDGVPMRPAVAYLTQVIDDRYKVLWLEDLTGAPQPPWALER